MDKMKFTFIEPEIHEVDEKKGQAVSYIRKTINVKEGILSAKIYMTALGVYKAYLNGSELDDQLLLPGFTNYHKRVQYQEYDITNKIMEGENTIGCILGDGWYRGYLGPFNKRNVYGKKIKLASTIILEYKEEREVIYTGEDWKATQDGPLLCSDIKFLESYDHRKEMIGWAENDFFDDHWHNCILSQYTGEVIPQEGERLLEHERFTPDILKTPDGNTILDFGQNLAGHVEFTVTGKAGTTVLLTMGETLDENGNFTLANNGMDKEEPEAMVLGQKLKYTLKDGRQTYKSAFLISGYQYVKLENWPEEIKKENFTSIAVYSDLKETGSFECSNPLINQLVKNVLWSEKSNFVDIPTDCPQRERAAWLGDINVFIETANYLTDTRRFISKWMNDVISGQKENGSIANILPEVPLMGSGTGSAGWADAVANVPMEQYRFYHDKDILSRVYDGVKKYVEFNKKRARKKHPLHLFKFGSHYKYILDTGFHFGEWLEPGESNLKNGLKALIYPDSEVATAWFYHTTKQFSEIAALLGKEDDQEEYATLAKKIRQAYGKEFISNGNINSKRQCKYVRPIYMGLASEDEKEKIATKLNKLCIENEYKIGTGFLSTYKILPVLTDCGYGETAYRMLENEKAPGWLYAVKKGATTIWENWYGIDEKGVPSGSFNHYAPGAVVSWLFSHCAGIKPLKPGFKEIEIKPVPGGTLTYAKAFYKSIAGEIVSEWKIEDGIFYLHVEVPEGVTGKIILPDGSEYRAKSGEYQCGL